MELVPTSLVEFYDTHLDVMKERGFQLMILALVRDADAPLFYSDLQRYWSSLEDVTGRDMLFAIAGPDAAVGNNYYGITKPKHGSSGFTNSNISIASRENSKSL